MSYPAGEPVDPLAPPTSPTPSIPGDPVSPYQPRPEAFPPGPASYPPPGPPPPGAYPGAEPGYPSYPGGSLPQPPLPPNTGYVVPSTYGAPMYGAGPGYPLPYDPLVLPPEADFGAWFSKVGEIARRSWRSALIVGGFGVTVPSAAVGLIGGVLGLQAGFNTLAFNTSAGEPITPADFGVLFGRLAILLVLAIASLFVGAAGWAGGVYALTVEATGQPVSVGRALRYGFSQCLRVGGWYLLVGLIAIPFVCACFVGVFYAIFAMSLFSFVALYERGQNPVSRSWRLTHSSFWPALGKVALLGVAYFAATLLIQAFFSIVTTGTGLAAPASPAGSVGLGLIRAVQSLILAPFYAMLLIGLLPVYTQLRAREEQITTPYLRASLGA